MRKTLKLIFVNLIVFFTLTLSLEVLFALIQDSKDIVYQLRVESDPRSLLLNYDWTEKHFNESSKLTTKYVSFIGWRSQYFSGETINIDSSGIRKTIPFFPLHTSNTTTIFLGGSTIWGEGVNDENTIPSLFSKYGLSKYSVLNFGESGYSAFQSSVFFTRYLASTDLNPELVISYDGVNNSPTFLPNPFEHPKELTIHLATKGIEKRKRFRIINLPNLRWALWRIKVRLTPWNEEKLVIKKSRNHTAAKELLESWLSIKRICMQENSRFICVLQPNIYVGKPDLANIKNMNLHPQFSTESYAYYTTVLKLLETEKYKNLKDNFLDLSQSLNGIANVYIDYCHLSPKGNAIIAEKIISYAEKTD